MQRAGSPVLLNAVVVTLAAACYGVAVFFHNQYVQAHGAVSQALRESRSLGAALPVGLPNPEAYFTRAEVMFYSGLVILGFAAVVAFGTKRWYGWLGLLVASSLIFAIPLWVLSRV